MRHEKLTKKPKTVKPVRRYRCRNCKKKMPQGVPAGALCDKCPRP